jgi:hypothetical protein
MTRLDPARTPWNDDSYRVSLDRPVDVTAIDTSHTDASPEPEGAPFPPWMAPADRTYQ